MTRHPTSAWVVQQLREAFPYDAVPKYLVFDNRSHFNSGVLETIKSFGIEPKQTSFRSPWLNEPHLKRLMNEYVHYYHVFWRGTTPDFSPNGKAEEEECRATDLGDLSHDAVLCLPTHSGQDRGKGIGA